MPAKIHQFPCLSDNFGVLIHDPETGATAAIDAPEAEAVEIDKSLDAATSRERILSAVDRRYTATSEAPRNWREERDHRRGAKVGQ